MSDERAVIDALEEDMESQTLVELTDDEGRVVRFRFVAAVEHEGSTYVVLADLEPTQDSEDELVLLRVETTADGQDSYVMLEDEAEVQAVFEKYVTATLHDALDGLEDVELEEADAEEDCACDEHGTSAATVLH